MTEAQQNRESDRKCPVLGCENSTKSTNLRFFRFPKEHKEYGKYAEIWSIFTRRKNFKPCSVECMCEVHFEPDLLKTGKKRRAWWLKPKAVPTIYYRNGEKVSVPFDPTALQYYGPEAAQLHVECENFVTDQEEDFIKKRYDRIKNLKNLCRFCFDENSTRTVAMSKLSTFSINPAELLDLVGVNSTVDLFSEIICEKCFKLIIEFDGYRKRCQKSQRECILELEELDRKILEIRKQKAVKPKKGSEVWFKVKIEEEFHEEFCDNFDDFQSSEFVEEEIVEEVGEESQMEFEEITVKNEVVMEEKIEGNKSFLVTVPTQKPSNENFNDSTWQQDDNSDSDTQESLNDDSNWQEEALEDLPDSQPPAKKKKVYPKDPVKQKRYTAEYTLRSFECFWCRAVLKGYTAFKTHRKTCKREVHCEAVGCRKLFTNQGIFNSHITKRHGMEKVTRYFCAVCNVNFQCNKTKFEDHCKKCIKENQFKEQKIECGICKQIFTSLQSFSAHKLFHGPDDSNLARMMQPKRGPVADEKKEKKKRIQITKVKEVICDICGKLFGNPNKLRRHHVDVHFVDFTGDLYYCDLCPVAKQTRRLIYTHMKATHMIKEHSCEVCGKLFKNRELWRKHILIHDESKRSNFCPLCPHLPGYNTKSALKKHHWKHHGGEQPARPFICEFCGAAYALEHLVMRHKIKVHNL